MEKQTYYVIGNEFYHYIKVFDEDEKDEALASLEDGEELHKVAIHDIKCSLLGLEDGEDDTVVVDINASIDDERDEFTFYVQTIDGEVRGEFNCWVTSANGTGEDYEFTDKESLIAKCVGLENVAEAYMADIIKEEDVFHPLDNTANYLTVLSNKETGKYKVVERNARYINKETSSGVDKYSGVYGVFDSLEEAEEWIEENYDEINQPDHVAPPYDYDY